MHPTHCYVLVYLFTLIFHPASIVETWRLGHDDFEVRQKASESLKQQAFLGLPASYLACYRKDDPEVQRRAREIVEGFLRDVQAKAYKNLATYFLDASIETSVADWRGNPTLDPDVRSFIEGTAFEAQGLWVEFGEQARVRFLKVNVKEVSEPAYKYGPAEWIEERDQHSMEWIRKATADHVLYMRIMIRGHYDYYPYEWMDD